jgi:glutamyl-tRNA synthetase
MKKVVTRFAPSPTGYIHIGNLRSAIYPWLVARQTGGTYILRIEDTDRARYVEGATELVLRTLRWVGLDWDEGPDVGGDRGPYYQTQRIETYHEWARKLIKAGLAYADPRTPAELDALRADAASRKEPFLARNYRPESSPAWEVGVPLRFKQTKLEPVAWDDAVYGKMTAGPEVLDDIILIKADGLPTYNFGHIVDDAEMGVTHVFRGQEYLSSMPNYLRLYEALGLGWPVFVHLPHILGPSGNKKLGKRDGAKSADDYRRDGILPEALLNFLASLGWNDGTEQEIYTPEELVQRFKVERIQRSSARFDIQKLLWLNGQWIRRLDFDDLYARTVDGGFWPEGAAARGEAYSRSVLAIIYDRLKTLGDLGEYTGYFFADPQIDLAIITGNKFLAKFSEAELAEMLATVRDRLEAVKEWGDEGLQTALNELLAATGRKPAELFSLVRIALSFASFSPALNQTMTVLGREVVLSRLGRVITALAAD